MGLLGPNSRNISITQFGQKESTQEKENNNTSKTTRKKQQQALKHLIVVSFKLQVEQEKNQLIV